MRDTNNFALKNVPDNVNQTSIALDSNQWIGCTFMAFFSDNTASGTLQIQYSNDLFGPLPPVNWANVPGSTATATIATGTTNTVYVPDNFFPRWLRIVFTSTGGSGNISVTYNAVGV